MEETSYAQRSTHGSHVYDVRGCTNYKHSSGTITIVGNWKTKKVDYYLDKFKLRIIILYIFSLILLSKEKQDITIQRKCKQEI